MSKVNDLIKDRMKSFSLSRGSDVYIFLSSGVDSNFLCLLLLECGFNVTAVSFRMNNVYSTDFLNAKRNSKTFNIGFVGIVLPDPSMLTIKNLRNNGCRKKTEFECMFPFMVSMKKIKDGVFFTGLGADGPFCISKSAMINFRKNKLLMKKHRNSHFENFNQINIINKICNKNQKVFHPFYCRKYYDYFEGKSWNDINLPRQKNVLWNSFSELKYINQYNHSNLQCGDTKIRNGFIDLADKYETTPIKMYNKVINESRIIV